MDHHVVADVREAAGHLPRSLLKLADPDWLVVQAVVR
jgi:hypothetical protein